MNMETLAYPTINMAATGERIKALRKARGLKVAQLSEYMGFTEPQAVYKWQRGESLPTVDNLFALSRILGAPMEDILVGDDEMSSRRFGENVLSSPHCSQNGKFELPVQCNYLSPAV